VRLRGQLCEAPGSLPAPDGNTTHEWKQNISVKSRAFLTYLEKKKAEKARISTSSVKRMLASIQMFERKH